MGLLEKVCEWPSQAKFDRPNKRPKMSLSAARPLITVYSEKNEATEAPVCLPAVFKAPIRPDIVKFVHTNIAKNSRIPYAVSRRAGHQTSAESWGTGRAVSRIPRVAGGGSHRSGQGAFGNMCRGGHMFAPTKTFRRWHRRVNKNVRRYAVCSALAASAVPALVMARGHAISQVPEIPLVVGDKIQSVNKTKQAVLTLTALNALADVQRVKDAKKIRPGKGKRRNRRYVVRRGPMIVFEKNQGGFLGFRNLPGVTLARVNRLNLLDLAPGAHLGRFIIWSESAFKALQNYFGDFGGAATARHYRLPTPIMHNSDVSSIINSKAIQAITRPQKPKRAPKTVTHNPLRHRETLYKLRPYEQMRRRMVTSAIAARLKAQAAGKPWKQAPKPKGEKKKAPPKKAAAKK